MGIFSLKSRDRECIKDKIWGDYKIMKLTGKRKWFLVVLSMLLIFVILYNAWHLWAARGSKSAEGIYLASGGETLLILKSAPLGRLKVSGSRIVSARPFMAPDKFTIKASFIRRRLFLNQKEIYGNSGSYYLKILLSLDLEPSQTIPGDWNLTKGKMGAMGKTATTSLLKGSFWTDDVFASHNVQEAFSKLYRTIVSQKWEDVELDHAKAPFPSFLHKLNDERIIDYFHKRLDNNISEGTLQKIRSISKDNPDDPYLSLHLVEMEIMLGNLETAESLWKEWNAKNRSHPDPFLLNSSREVFKSLCMKRIKTNHPALPGIEKVFGDPPANLDATLSWFHDFWKTDQLDFTSSYPLVPSSVPTGFAHFPRVPNFLEFQVKTKVCRILGQFYLFQGRCKESLSLLCALYRLGQSLNSNGILIQRLIGIAIRAIATGGLECYVLNACCETEEEFRKCVDALSRLHNTPGTDVAENLFVGEYSFLRTRMIEVSPPYSNYLEAETRYKVSDMKFELVRMAAAARYHLASKGDFPSSVSDLSSFLKGERPEDAFDEKAPLKFLRISENQFSVYSIGPDKTDDKAAFSYDPTNGTITPGDIFIQIPREREYPFPREAVRASNAYELLEQFPNGLPADGFADTKGRPFSILESSDNTPLIIFSFAPNTDEADFTPYSGSSSKEKQGEFEPVTTPEPPSNASYGRSLQWVMRRSDKIPPSPGYWTLEPMYDPTNGTISPGDIFIEIPK
jgi:hypothetical protein